MIRRMGDDPTASVLNQSSVWESRLRFLLPAAILAVTAAVYLPALSFGFVCDDAEQIVTSQPRYTWSALPSYFTSDIWSYTAFVKTNYYRPGFLVWLLLNSRAFGLNTVLWHAAAIALHLAATLLFYFLARRLAGNAFVAAAAALLFGLHPAHVEAVAWLSGVTETLFAILAFSSLLCYMRGRRASALLLFAAALFTKETAVVLPVLFAAWDWMFPSSPDAPPRERLRAGAATLAVCLCIFLVYAGMRVHALGSFAPLLRVWTPRMWLATAPSVLLFYLHQLLVPVQYSLMYAVSPLTAFGWKQTGEPVLILAAAALALLWLARQSRALAFAALLLLLPILPVLNFRAFAYDDLQHDRYLYLPSAGLCLLLAMAAARFLRWPALRLGLLAAASAALAYANVQSSGVWVNNLTLYTHAAEIAPDSILVAEYLGDELVNQQRFAEALPLLRKVLLADNRPSVYENIALCYMGLEDYQQANAFLWRAISVYPRAHAPHYYMAQLDLRQGKWSEAEAEAREALRLRPEPSPVLAKYHSPLAEALIKQQNWSGALAEYQAELRENPGSEEARTGLLDLQQRMPAP